MNSRYGESISIMGRTFTTTATFVSSKLDNRKNLVHCFQIEKSLYDELEKIAALAHVANPYKCWYTSVQANVENREAILVAMAAAPDVFGSPNDSRSYICFSKNELTAFPKIEKNHKCTIVFCVSYFSTKDIPAGFSAKLLSVQ